MPALGLPDLEAMPDAGRRYELLGGAIVATATPGPIHQLTSARLLRLLQDAVPEDHAVFHAPIDLDLPGEQRVQPDLIVVPWAGVGAKRLSLPVILVVEIISAGSRIHDAVTKRAVYADAGIPAYWIIDPTTEQLTALRVGDDGAYHPYAEGTAVTVDWPFAVNIDVGILAHRPA